MCWESGVPKEDKETLHFYFPPIPCPMPLFHLAVPELYYLK